LLRFLDHTQTQTHSVGPVLTSDQLVAEAIIYTTHKERERKFFALIGLQTRDPTKKSMQFYPLNRSAIGIGVDT